ncbi:hypothetical protein WICPIJ_006633, partial [Wickerhamomyces pijperi]
QNSINKGIIAEYYKLGKELEYQFHSSLERCIQEKEHGHRHGHGHAVKRQAAETSSTLTLDESMIKGLWRWYYRSGKRRMKMATRFDQRRYDQYSEEYLNSEGPDDESIRMWRLPFNI